VSGPWLICPGMSWAPGVGARGRCRSGRSRRDPVLSPCVPPAPWHCGGMQSVYEAAGGSEGLLRLATAWHCRVMAGWTKDTLLSSRPRGRYRTSGGNS
jgi:hypothetical protein